MLKPRKEGKKETSQKIKNGNRQRVKKKSALAKTARKRVKQKAQLDAKKTRTRQK